ncbi:MAG: helix-turn-helix domain-containing protein, partial [Desulfobacterales bacterium]
TARSLLPCPMLKLTALSPANYISEVLESVDGNRKKAAERLGIHRNTLLSKTIELGLNANK